MSLIKITNYYYLRFIILLIIFSYNQINCYVKCIDGPIALDYSYCPSSMTCPDYYIRINAYSCAISQIFATPSKCRTNLECWSGECVSIEDELYTLCPTSTSCPVLMIKCPDNSCVSDINKCPEYFDCPPSIPNRCPNGDCRRNLEDCPSLIHCPDISPVLCNDGSCRVQKDKCEFPSQETACKNKERYRCSDGTCTNSKFLCPTLVTCPIGFQKCFDGICRPKGNCNDEITPICNQDEQILCQFDSSCASEITNCPTGIICPFDKPVKCWDNSCRDSINNCPNFQSCRPGLKQCADGSCSESSCGTHITCSAEAPYRCFDNTCRRNPEDCPAQPSCPSEKPILCWDGRCLSERDECLSPSKCDKSNPVKCPNGICTKSAADCKEEIGCPSGFVLCKDGTCRGKLDYCPKESCPANLPYKCTNGLCVSDEKYCDKDNGCPFYLPIKCNDGSCVLEIEECPDKISCPLKRPKLCPDGSCVEEEGECPSIMGCPKDTPYRCANGECININLSSCQIPTCDLSIPFKCSDGLCVSSASYCPSENKKSSSGNVICANGLEANSFNECKPLVKCKEGEIRCEDGSCRKSEKNCPIGSTCPKGEIRCQNGSCAKDKNFCPIANGCSEAKQFKCPGNGYCVSNLDICEKYKNELVKSNGCPPDRPYKCQKTKKCVAYEEECEDFESACSKGQIMCYDGYCTSNLNECSDDEHFDVGCRFDGRVAYCFDNYNVYSDPCAETFGDCFNSLNCKIDTPFRCLNGDCKRYPSKIHGSDGCDIGISCPIYKPYLCADGSCVEESSFCKSYSECPEDAPYLCDDKICSKSKDDCDKNHKKCPSKNPILCPNGNCVSGIYDCNEDSCPNWYPYYSIIGECKKSPRDCQKIIITEEFEIVIGTVCKDDEYICIDGSCREKAEDCPIYRGCVTSDAPFKCLDGGCSKDKDSCKEKNAKEYFYCPENTMLCEDGICRNNCSLVEFNGCPNEHPLLCSDGRCVSQELECLDYSTCNSTENIFRCIDGTCGSSLVNCKTPFREVGDTNVLISVFSKIPITAELIIGPNNTISGKVEIPADTIISKIDGSPVDTQISFRSVTRNKIIDTTTTYDKRRVDDLKSIYPYADPDNNYSLNYQYTVLSSVIEIKLKEPETTEISGKILLSLLFDFPYKHEKLEQKDLFTELSLNYNKDVCLAKLNKKTRKWECNRLNFKVELQNDLQLTGELNEEGIYAVILNLRINDNKIYKINP